MAAYEVGTRVGAVLSTDETTARLFGFGVYDGPRVPPHGPCGLTIGEMSKHGPFTNPRITLDSGKIVWGMECWWGLEDQVRKMIGNREVVMVDIDEERAKAARR